MRSRLSAGGTMNYAEILRTVGQYADRAKLIEVRILETADGLILQGVVAFGEKTGQRETYQLTVEDIQDLRRDAQAKRGKLI